MADLFYYLFVNPFTGTEPHIYPFISICIMLNTIYAIYLVIDVIRSEVVCDIQEENGFRFIHVDECVFTRAIWGYGLAMFLELSLLFFGGLAYVVLAPTTQSLENISFLDYLKQLLVVIGVDAFFWVVIFVTCAIFAPIIESIRLSKASKVAR